MEQQQQEDRVYRGIKLADSVKLCKNDGSYYIRTKNALDKLADKLDSNKHILLSPYHDDVKKILIDFKCNHDPHWIKPANYKSGKGCPKCRVLSANNARLSIGQESFISLLETNGHILRSEYLKGEEKVLIDFKCEHGPRWMKPADYKHGSRCPKCSGVCIEQSKGNLIHLVASNGHALLTEYKNNKTKVLIDYKCEHGLQWITPSNYKQGQGCIQCGYISTAKKKKEKSLEELYNLLKSNGHYWIDGEYIGAHEKILIDFVCGHEPQWITPNNYKQGNGCTQCGYFRSAKAKKDKSEIEFLSLIEKNGHTLLSPYVKNNEKVFINFKCEHGPSWITPNDYKQGIRCGKCKFTRVAETRSRPYRKYFENLVKVNGHVLMSPYINAREKVLIDFNCEHEPVWIVAHSYKKGNRCQKCANIEITKILSKKAGKRFRKLVNSNRHVLLSEYEGDEKKVLIDFKCGHGPVMMTPHNYKQGNRCSKCAESKGERIIREWLESKGIVHEIQYIFPKDTKRYDFFLPLEDLIIEVQGIQHYKEVDFSGKGKGRTLVEEQANDKRKQEFAESRGYKYIIVDYREGDPQLTLERFIEAYNKLEA